VQGGTDKGMVPEAGSVIDRAGRKAGLVNHDPGVTRELSKTGVMHVLGDTESPKKCQNGIECKR
jgi:hypothetical protein